MRVNPRGSRATATDLAESLTLSGLLPDATKKKHAEVVQFLLQQIGASIVQDGLELRGIGAFHVAQRAARHARNINTGEPMVCPESWRVVFKPSKLLNDRAIRLRA